MIVKEDKSLLSWLSRELEPLTMADPETLAEYVIALLKNDKEIDALMAFCIEQLHDFLKENTKGFVKDLFRVLEDESYINAKPSKHKADEDENEDDDDDHKIDFNRRRRGDDEDDDDNDRSSRRRSSNQEDEENSNSFRNKRRKSDIPTTAAASVTARAKTISTTSSSSTSRTAALSAPLSSSQNRHSNSSSSSVNQNASSSSCQKGSSNSSGGGNMHKNINRTSRDTNNHHQGNKRYDGRDASIEMQHDYRDHPPVEDIHNIDYYANNDNINNYMLPSSVDFNNNNMYPPLPFNMMMMAGIPPPYPPTANGGFYSPYGIATGMYGGVGGMYGGVDMMAAAMMMGQQQLDGVEGIVGEQVGLIEREQQQLLLQDDEEMIRRRENEMLLHQQQPALPPPHPTDEYYHHDDGIPFGTAAPHLIQPPPLPLNPTAAAMNGGKLLSSLPTPPPPITSHNNTQSQSPQRKPVPPPRVPLAPPSATAAVTNNGAHHPLPPPLKPRTNSITSDVHSDSLVGGGFIDTNASVSTSNSSTSISPPIPSSALPAATAMRSWSTLGSMYPYYGSGTGMSGVGIGGSIPGMMMMAGAGGSSMFNYSNLYGGSMGAANNAAATMNATGGAFGMGVITAATAGMSGSSTNTAYDGSIPQHQQQQSSQNQNGGGGGRGCGGGSGYRKPYQPRNSGGSSGSGYHGSSKTTNDLPESERCTLLCTGIPTYIKEEEIMHHFRTFGRVVQLQVTSSSVTDASASSSTAATSESSTTATAEASSSSSSDKKTYNECLVQFSNSDEAKKCYSSPTAVLNNRFIRITQSNFNVIPPADVPPATAEELAELQAIQQAANQAKFGNKTATTAVGATGTDSGLSSSSTSQSQIVRVPRSLTTARPVLLPGAKFVKNKKYIAGVTPDTPTAAPTPAVASAVVVNSAAAAVSTDGEETNTYSTTIEQQNLEENGTTTDGATALPAAPVTHTLVTPASLSSVQVSPRSVAPVPTAAQVKQDGALQQQYEDLRKLRSQVDNIWKIKQTLLQSQIDKCREMIATIEASSTADKMRDTVETIESKIVDLQSQLRVVQEQRATGTLQQPSQQQQQAAAAAATAMSGRWYTRGGGRGGGRGSSSASNSYVNGSAAAATVGGGRGVRGSTVGGRWQQPSASAGATGGRAVGGRGGYGTGGAGTSATATTPAKNMVIDNRPRSLLISTAEWMKLPDSFTSKIEEHFSRFGEVKNMSSLSNGDLLIEYGNRREAESAMYNGGANYEGSTMKLEWYQSPVQQH